MISSGAVAGVCKYLHVLMNLPDERSGSAKWVGIGEKLMGKSPPVLVNYLKSQQVSVFGGFPNSQEVASLVFAAIFAILAIIHLVVFGVNFSRHHYFYLSLGFVVYCTLRVIGFVTRIFWSRDLTNINLGIVSQVFMIVSLVLLVGFNMMLASRWFTGRFPRSYKIISRVVILLYIIGGLIIVMTTICTVIPHYYFVSTRVWDHYYRGSEAASLLLVLYSLTSVGLLVLGLLCKDENSDFCTYQPWWIESFSPLYFVKKERDEECMQHNTVRTIITHQKTKNNSTDNPSNTTNNNLTLSIILTSTILLLITSTVRCILIFQAKTVSDSNLSKPIVMYICYGGFEVVINLLYIIGRVDLRFYRPDRLPRKVNDESAIEYLVNLTMNNPTPVVSSTNSSITSLNSTDTWKFYSPRLGVSQLSVDEKPPPPPNVPTPSTTTIIKMIQKYDEVKDEEKDEDEFRF